MTHCSLYYLRNTLFFAISVRSKLNTLDFRYFFGCFHFHHVGVIMVVTEYTYVLST